MLFAYKNLAHLLGRQARVHGREVIAPGHLQPVPGEEKQANAASLESPPCPWRSGSGAPLPCA
jgi:hypothetical protein